MTQENWSFQPPKDTIGFNDGYWKFLCNGSYDDLIESGNEKKMEKKIKQEVNRGQCFPLDLSIAYVKRLGSIKTRREEGIVKCSKFPTNDNHRFFFEEIRDKIVSNIKKEIMIGVIQ